MTEKKMSLAEAINFADIQDGFKKETYTFRCNPIVLAKLSDYAKVNHTTLPKLINLILLDFTNKHIENFKEYNFNVSYIELPIVEKTLYVERELKSCQKTIDELSEIIVNLKNEMNREFMKKEDIK